MDRSTGRVLVPFFRLRCALAASLLRCRVGERSLAIEERGRERKQGRGQEGRERRRRWEGGSTTSQVLTINRLSLGSYGRPLETPQSSH